MLNPVYLDTVRLLLDAVEVLPAAGRQVVEHAHALTGSRERSDEVAADEPGAPGDQIPNLRHVRLDAPQARVDGAAATSS